MKHIIGTFIFNFLFVAAAYSQNHVRKIFVVPQQVHFATISRRAITTTAPATTLQINLLESNQGNSSFLSDLPVIKIKETIKKIPGFFFAELALNDMLENSVNNFNGNLLNTYDDSVTELFRDAPSIIKVKCIIPF